MPISRRQSRFRPFFKKKKTRSIVIMKVTNFIVPFALIDAQETIKFQPRRELTTGRRLRNVIPIGNLPYGRRLMNNNYNNMADSAANMEYLNAKDADMAYVDDIMKRDIDMVPRNEIENAINVTKQCIEKYRLGDEEVNKLLDILDILERRGVQEVKEPESKRHKAN